MTYLSEKWRFLSSRSWGFGAASLGLHLLLLVLVVVLVPKVSLLRGNPFSGRVIEWRGMGGGSLPARHLPQQRSAPETENGELSRSTQLPTESVVVSAESNRSGVLASGEGVFGESGDLENDLLRQVRERLERAKRYPISALRLRLEGATRVRFRIDPEGHPQNIEIVESSGVDLLDQASLATVERAAPYPLYAGLIDVPLQYELRAP